MVRAASDRINKYTAKLVGDVIKNRIDAQKEFMVAQVADKFPELVNKETAIKSLLNGWGTSTIEVPFYLSYGRKLYGLSLKHQDEILIDEACIAYKAWFARGLDGDKLVQIASDVFTIPIADCTA